jgi:hypothetical protein
MSITAFPRIGGKHVARDLLRMIIDNGHVERICQETGRTMMRLELEDWQQELLDVFDAGSEDFEEEGDGEEDLDAI